MKWIAVLVSVALAAIDQLTKKLAVTYLKPVGSIPLLKFGETEWLNLTYCENTGMSFSLLEGQRVLLTALPLVLIVAIEWYIFSGRAKTKPRILALAAIAGGGLGNLIDRALMGHVVDFIDVKIIHFAIFNFADMCAVCGGIVFVLIMYLDEKKEKKEREEKTDEKL
ncbi:MAG: signal peptidase II [Eubacterium sp.]|nr:signal peptidase II [Eubacterium sp.]MCM1417333.1 signal peptidase II [Roseburia sp.]